jgi:protein SCO1/2
MPLSQALFDGRPVVLSFMFSSCATVCPITNHTLVTLEGLLGERRARVNTVSLSIDPDHDSVRALADYARRTGGRGSYFTGDPGTSEAVQRAFDVWRGDKMNHQPVFLLSAGPGKPWVRLDGLVSPRVLLDELARLGVP